MSTVYVTFTIVVSDNAYRYSAIKKGEASLEMQAPRAMLDNLNAGDLLRVTLASALEAYDASEKEEEQA